AEARTPDATGVRRGRRVPHEPLGVRVGYRLDLGAARAAVDRVCRRHRRSRPLLGPRRAPGTEASEQSAVVIRISVVIPTRNEAASIGRVLDDIPRPPVTDVVVVDAESTDGTPAVAAAHGARVINEPRRGYG